MIKVFKGRKSDILSALTLNDVTYWSGDYFVAVVFALFVTELLGGSADDVGILFGLYFITRSISAIPVGRYFDTHKGHTDEYLALILSCLTTGCLYILLSFSTQLWNAYVIMIALGVTQSITNLAWKVLFYTNVPERSEGRILSRYESLSQLTWGFSVIVSGFVADSFGYSWAIFIGGLIAFVSSFIIIVMYQTRNRF